MTRYLAYYYLLFFALIMGAFASMAQNAYGMTILGGSAFCFSLLFIIQWVSTWQQKEKNWLRLAELTLLVILSVLLAFRVFNIHFQGVEIIFTITALLLALVYSVLLWQWFMGGARPAGKLKWLILSYYLSLILFLLTVCLSLLIPRAAAPSGFIALIFLILFIAGSWISRNSMVDGEKTSGFQLVSRLKDRSTLLLSLFLLFTLYSGLTRLGWLPKMYTSVYPQTYYQLIGQAETGKDVPVEGKFRFEIFREGYDRFAEKHLAR